MTSKTCSECPAWCKDEQSPTMGACRASPPVPVLAPQMKNQRQQTLSMWPVTTQDQWCVFGRDRMGGGL